MLPVSFVTCSGRVVSVTFFLLEESDCSRLGASPMSLVVGFRKNGCRRVFFLVDLFCEGWLWYVLCVAYNFSRLRLFCAGSGLTVLLCVGKNILPVLHHIGRCRGALPVCHPWMLPKVDHVNRWCTCFYEL